MSSDLYEGTFYGQILPMDWGNDTVAGVMILVDGEEELIVEPDKNGQKLLEHIDMWVNVEGIVKESDDELRIKVRDFAIEDGDWNYGNDDRW